MHKNINATSFPNVLVDVICIDVIHMMKNPNVKKLDERRKCLQPVTTHLLILVHYFNFLRTSKPSPAHLEHRIVNSNACESSTFRKALYDVFICDPKAYSIE